MPNYASAVRCYQGRYNPTNNTFIVTKEIPLCSLRGVCYTGDRNTGPVLSNDAAFLYGTGFTLDSGFAPSTANIEQVRMRDPETPSKVLRAVSNLDADRMIGVNLSYSTPRFKGVVFSSTPGKDDPMAYCVVLLSFNSIYQI